MLARNAYREVWEAAPEPTDGTPKHWTDVMLVRVQRLVGHFRDAQQTLLHDARRDEAVARAKRVQAQVLERDTDEQELMDEEGGFGWRTFKLPNGKRVEKLVPWRDQKIGAADTMGVIATVNLDELHVKAVQVGSGIAAIVPEPKSPASVPSLYAALDAYAVYASTRPGSRGDKRRAAASGEVAR